MSSRRAVLLAAAVTSSGVMPLFFVGALGVRLRAELGFDEAALGVAVGASPFVGVLASAVFGRFTERIGATVALRTAALIAAAGMFGVALFARSWGTLVAFLLVAGLATALGQPATTLWVVRAVAPERHGLALGLRQAAAPTTALLAGIAVPVVAATLGWRWMFVMGAAIPLCAALAVPRQIPERGPRVEPGGTADLSLRPMLLLTAAMALGTASVMAFVGFLVSAGVEAGMTESAAALLFAFGSLVGISSRVLLGHLADRRPGRHLLVVSGLLMVGALAYLLLATGNRTLLYVAAPLAFATGWGWPGLFALSIARANTGAPAAATGITLTGGNFGAFIGPFVFGALVSNSYTLGWLVASATAATAAVTMLLGRRMAMRDIARRRASLVGRE